jgi:NADPH:quinone reductase-like Zn-dependent oxidoreductase
VLQPLDTDPPEPGEGEVLMSVRAASVNPIDWKYRQGIIPKGLPAVLGAEASGTVERSRAEGFAVGEDIFGIVASGGYAELATAPAATIAKKPDGISHEQAAALPIAGMTAWQALFDRGGLQHGQRLLVAGAAGGVGHLAVQFAKHAGASVIGTGSSRNREFVLGLGAEEYLDYGEQDVGELVRDVDVALDTVGRGTTQSLMFTVRRGGILVSIAGTPSDAEAAERGIRAERLSMSPNARQLSLIAELVSNGVVRVEIAETLPLSEVARAHELSESGHVRGKIVLTI